MKLNDHESDTMTAARFGTPPATPPSRVHRESWLDKLARHLGATPVDHFIIPPATIGSARRCSANAGNGCAG